MSNREARNKLFDRFSRELTSLVPEATGRYCCPLCLELFDRSEVDELLTLEHVIPDGLGKRLPALTCKRCNNDVGGAKIDSHLQRKVAIELFSKGFGEPIQVELRVGDHRLAANSERIFGEKGIENAFHIVGKASAPAAIQGSEETLRAMSDGSELHVRFRVAAERRAQLALLKAGYLLGFLRLGYRFILSNKLDLLRKQIQEPGQELLPLDALVVGLPNLAKANSLIIVTEPAEIQSILAVLEVRSPPPGSSYWGVFLPDPDSPPGFYDRAQSLRQSGVNVQLSGQQLAR